MHGSGAEEPSREINEGPYRFGSLRESPETKEKPENSNFQSELHIAAQRKIAREEINKTIVAPLLFICASLLFIAAIGAAVSGSLVIAAFILIAPIAIGWFLLKAQQV